MTVTHREIISQSEEVVFSLDAPVQLFDELFLLIFRKSVHDSLVDPLVRGEVRAWIVHVIAGLADDLVQDRDDLGDAVNRKLLGVRDPIDLFQNDLFETAVFTVARGNGPDGFVEHAWGVAANSHATYHFRRRSGQATQQVLKFVFLRACLVPDVAMKSVQETIIRAPTVELRSRCLGNLLTRGSIMRPPTSNLTFGELRVLVNE